MALFLIIREPAFVHAVCQADLCWFTIDTRYALTVPYPEFKKFTAGQGQRHGGGHAPQQ